MRIPVVVVCLLLGLSLSSVNLQAFRRRVLLLYGKVVVEQAHCTTTTTYKTTQPYDEPLRTHLQSCIHIPYLLLTVHTLLIRPSIHPSSASRLDTC